MKIGPYVEKLEKSKEYKSFQKKYPDAFMVAGFFVIDFDAGHNVHQIDFYVPSEKKVAAFTLDGGVQMQMLNLMNFKVPPKLEIPTNIDLDALPGILLDEMHNRNMSEEIRKMIAVVQNVDGNKIWNINCVLSGMELLRSHVEDSSKTVLKIEKSSMMDIIKKIPASAMMKKGAVPNKGGAPKLDDLKKIQSELEKEKSELKKQIEKEKKDFKGSKSGKSAKGGKKGK